MAATAAKRWTPSELSVLEARRAAKVAPELIAAELQRSVSSVINRAQRANKRRADTRFRAMFPTYEHEETQFVVPPAYVRRERDIRFSIPPSSTTQFVFSDPVDGYSALATKTRKISVQDALEICALSTGRRGEIVAFAEAYGVSQVIVRRILNGQFFERLLPENQHNQGASA